MVQLSLASYPKTSASRGTGCVAEMSASQPSLPPSTQKEGGIRGLVKGLLIGGGCAVACWWLWRLVWRQRNRASLPAVRKGWTRESGSLHVHDCVLRIREAVQPHNLSAEEEKWVTCSTPEFKRLFRESAVAGTHKGVLSGIRCVVERLGHLQIDPHQECLDPCVKPALCANCWIVKKHCMCPSSSWLEGMAFPHQLHLFMSHKEFGRGSNSGKILLCSLPHNSHLYVSNIHEDEERLVRLLQEEKGRVFILFPSTTSIEAEELAATWRSKCAEASTSPTSEASVMQQQFSTPLHFIVLDATWPQARTLRKWLLKQDETLPEVKLSPPGPSSFVVRKLSQHSEGRICTLEAATLLLENLGYPEVSPMLLTNLRIMVRKFLIASCKSNTSKGEHLAALEILDPR